MENAYYSCQNNFFSGTLIIANDAVALDTRLEEKICSEIGFKKKSEAFAECVLELITRQDKGGLNDVNNVPAGIKTRVEDEKDIRFLSSYVSSPARSSGYGLWDLSKLSSNAYYGTYLYRADKSIYDTIKVSDAKSIYKAAELIASAAGVKATFLLKEADDLNAYAGFDKNGSAVVVINKPMFDVIAKDKDMAAALLGHEISHLYFKHGENSAEHRAVGNIIGVIAGIALEGYAQKKTHVRNLGLDAGKMIGVAYTTSFSRDQEREADHQGQIWAKQAGYDPNGSEKLFRVLESKGGNSVLPFFQTHPNPSERIENARKNAERLR